MTPDPLLEQSWQRLLANGAKMPRADFLQKLVELYWACLSRLVRLVTDADA